jgi:fructosamine-3-kinase
MRVFRKALPLSQRDRLDAEVDGLAAVAATGTLRVPRLLARGEDEREAWLELEWIDASAPTASAEAALGRGLAALHRHTGPAFGWPCDNWIGGSPQRNAWDESWARFFATRRLGAQREFGERNGMPRRWVDRLVRVIDAVPALLGGHDPPRSLVHGDLWGGNWLATAAGEAVLIDPAAYYGDRETDLAMTRLFGGFGPAFYAAYESAWPRPSGAAGREALYHLYHLANHANLFGGDYVDRASRAADEVLRAA